MSLRGLGAQACNSWSENTAGSCTALNVTALSCFHMGHSVTSDCVTVGSSCETQWLGHWNNTQYCESFYSKTSQIHQCIKFSLHVADSLSIHHQEFKTVHTAKGICQTDPAVCLLVGTKCVIPK